MRLCFLATWSGAVHVQEWIKHFVRRGDDVHLVTHSHEEVPGATVHTLLTFPKINFITGPVEVSRQLRRIRPDVVHADLLTPYGFYAAASGFHPVLVSSRGSDALINPRTSAVFRRMDRFVLGRADAVHAISQYLAGELVALGANPDKVVTIPIGVDPSRFNDRETAQSRGAALRHSLGWVNNPIVISTRHFEPVYNLEQLLRAIPLILNEDGNIRFLIVGHGSQDKALKALSKRLGVDEFVRFTGLVCRDDLPGHLVSSCVYVSTSRSDAQGVSLLEAISCGCFPVTTDIPAAREWVQQGVNGFLVPVGDSAALADGVLAALADKSLRDTARGINRCIVRERGDWKTTISGIEHVYEGLTQCHQ